MKKMLLFAIAALAFSSCMLASSADHPVDVGKSKFVVNDNPSFEISTPYVADTTIVIVVRAYDVNELQSITHLDADLTPQYRSMTPIRKYWTVPMCIGVSDTKRHYSWKFFHRKLC